MIATKPAHESASEEAVGGHHVTMGSEASPLRVFISYSHDSPEHADRVLALADRLRQDGIDSILDQYILGSPDEGWPRWMDRQIRDADFVLMICTPTYYRRVMGEETTRGRAWRELGRQSHLPTLLQGRNDQYPLSPDLTGRRERFGHPCTLSGRCQIPTHDSKGL